MVVLGSRGSHLARAMADEVLAALTGLYPEVDFRQRVITTTGDRDRRTELSVLGGDYGGTFTKALEVALLNGEIDIAMHSLKDLPTVLPDGLSLAAIPTRDDARDALCGSRLAELAIGARVGTGSPRRRAQLLHARPDLDIVQIRGNVTPRLSRLESSASMAAIVLATAGLKRVGLEAKVTEVLPADRFAPAAGQGAIALEVRTVDAALRTLLEAVEDASTRTTVTAERALLHELGGGCSLPVGAHCVLADGALRLRGQVTSLDGTLNVFVELDGPLSHPEALGRDVAESLLTNGGATILRDILSSRESPSTP